MLAIGAWEWAVTAESHILISNFKIVETASLLADFCGVFALQPSAITTRRTAELSSMVNLSGRN